LRNRGEERGRGGGDDGGLSLVGADSSQQGGGFPATGGQNHAAWGAAVANQKLSQSPMKMREDLESRRRGEGGCVN